MPHDWIWQYADWPRFRWDAAQLAPSLASARRIQGELVGSARWLDEALTNEAMAAVLIEDGLTTSAIEGEKLDPAAVRSSVARRLNLATAGYPPPPRKVDGLIDVLSDATDKFDQPLTCERLCAWQAALFPTGYSGIRPIRTGAIRLGAKDMKVVSGGADRERVHFIAPPSARLEMEMDRFVEWFSASRGEIDGLVRAGLAHLWFVTLHPFDDGNGRIARAITDMALAQDENRPLRLFSLSAQILRERSRYYERLEQTQRGDLAVTEWFEWFAAQVENAAAAAQRSMDRTLAKARFWVRHHDTDINERQRKALNRVLNEGPGGFEGGLTTQKYGRLTGVSRATAYRELVDLVHKGCLRSTPQGGRSSAYEIVWADPDHPRSADEDPLAEDRAGLGRNLEP